jgi:hypothetical protein
MSEHKEYDYGGEVDEWEPIKRKSEHSDIQSHEHQISFQKTHAGEVKVWTRVRLEEMKMRRTLALRILRLVEISVIVGLTDFIITGNPWLLTTSGAVYVIFQIVLNYYFYRPRK